MLHLSLQLFGIFIFLLVFQVKSISSDEGDCTISDSIENNFISKDNNTGKFIIPGQNVSELTTISYSCPQNYFMEGNFKTNFCLEGQWINEHPKCLKMCPPIKGITIRPICTFKGESISCDNFVPPGTVAKILCDIMYQVPQNRQVRDELACENDGRWNAIPFKCEQICGTVDYNKPYSVNSELTPSFKVPWNVGIYRKNLNEKYEHICGGTLVEPKIVISAAHCFWNNSNAKLTNEENFMVAVGKYYRDFYSRSEPNPVQFSNLTKIDIPLLFEGANYDYSSDIAILTLTDPIRYMNHIRPACLRWKNFNEKYIPTNYDGVVAGWGITDNNTYSPELRSVELKSIDGNKCKDRLNNNKKLARDKFCVETYFGKNVCEGDSGGGYLVPEIINNTKYFQLWGVVSNGFTNLDSFITECNSEFITSFTNVQFYEEFYTKIKSLIVNDPYDENGCYVPIDYFMTIKNKKTNTDLKPGFYTEELSLITYSCPQGFFVDGITQNNFCLKGSWVIGAHPKCTKMCPPIEGRSIKGLCKYQNRSIFCDNYVLPGTTAKISCKNNFYKLPNNGIELHDELRCQDGGKWDYEPFVCEELCSIPSVNDLMITDNKTGNELIPNSFVKNATEIAYSCQENFYFDGDSKTNICIDGSWKHKHPKCLTTCPVPYFKNVEAICTYHDKTISCFKPVPIGTSMVVKCDSDSLPTDVYDTTKSSRPICQWHGQWNYKPSSCEKCSNLTYCRSNGKKK